MNQISSPADFKGTKVPILSQMDALLRCNICKNFLTIPVLTPCGHTFCSMCIRGYLSNNPKCPLCLNELRESMLRSEYLVNEIVETFKSARMPLLQLMEKDVDDNSLIELRSAGTEGDSDLKEIDEQTNTCSESDEDVQILQASSTNPQTKRNRKQGENATENGQTQIKKMKTNAFTSVFEQMKDKTISEQVAECPICEQFYPIAILERSHLDECLTLQTLASGKPNDKSVKSKSETPATIQCAKKSNIIDAGDNIHIANENNSKSSNKKNCISHIDRYLSSVNKNTSYKRLPKVTFSSLSISQIKQKLLALGLPTQGSRTNLIARYTYYEMLWNSNFCDSIHPLDESELKRQLLSWEATHNASSSGLSSNKTISQLMRQNGRSSTSYEKMLTNFKKDTFDRKGWSLMFQKEFHDLKKEARSKLVKHKP